MKRLIIIMIVILVAVAGVVIKTKSLKSQQLRLAVDERPPEENRLNWYAAKAKEQGIAEVPIASPMVEYLGGASADLTEALSSYSLVVAKPIQAQTIIDQTEHIVTWYKFEIVEVVNKTDKSVCMTCPIPLPPKEMFPVYEDEFVAGKYGGTVEVDGIKIKAIDNQFPDFKTGKEYLLFISRYDNGAATIGIGPNSIFTVENDGNLKKFNSLPNRVKEDIERNQGKSLLSVRVRAKQFHDSKKTQ